MFTGLVQDLGTVDRVDQNAGGVRLSVRSPLAAELSEGDSIAVNGVCLTAVGLCGGDLFGADVMHETLRRSSLGEVQPGSQVNLELPLRAADRLGGHIVQGHVDGIAVVAGRRPAEHWHEIDLDLPDGLSRYVVEKGSITADGVSLTVAAISGDRVTIGLIPETLARTTLGRRATGERVNIEVDVLAKYVERLLAAAPERRIAT